MPMIRETIEVPDDPNNDTLCSIARIKDRVRGMAFDINEDYAQKKPVVICVLASGLVFTADLIRAITRPLEIGFMRATSYKDGKKVSVNVEDFLPDRIDVGDRDVLIVDGICETGISLARVAELLNHTKKVKPKSIKTCVFAVKQTQKKLVIPIDYKGIIIPECLVYGYGINHMGKFRNEPRLMRLMHPDSYPELASGLEDSSEGETDSELALVSENPPPAAIPQSGVVKFDQLLTQVQEEWTRLRGHLHSGSDSET